MRRTALLRLGGGSSIPIEAYKRKGVTTMAAHLLCAWLFRKLGCQFARGWLNKNRTIGEDDGWHRAHAAIDFHDVGGGFVVFFDIDIFVGNAMGVEREFRHTAIATPGGSVNL